MEKNCWWIFGHKWLFQGNIGVDARFHVIALFSCEKCGRMKRDYNPVWN
jgi:hypothetical protein